MNVPTIEDHRALVEQALDEYEAALDAFEIWLQAWLARQRGYEGYDG